MDTPQFDIDLEQGIPRDFVIQDWADGDGNFYDLSDGYTAQLTVRDLDTDAVMLNLVSPAAIVLSPREIATSFTADMTSAMVPRAGELPYQGSPASAPKYLSGVYELCVTRAGVPYPVMRGNINITTRLLSQ